VHSSIRQVKVVTEMGTIVKFVGWYYFRQDVCRLYSFTDSSVIKTDQKQMKTKEERVAEGIETNRNGSTSRERITGNRQ
jgi:hypothetical protein